MARLFVAVWPPPDVLELVAALPRPEVPGLRWTTPDQWHVTLRFLGRVDDPEVAAGALSAAALAPAEAALGPSVSRFGRRVLHVPAGGLTALAAAVTAATADVGEPPEDRPFTGHLTLARATGRGSGVDLRALAGTRVEARWRVDEVALVRSHLSSAGARYEVVRRFPTRVPPAIT